MPHRTLASAPSRFSTLPWPGCWPFRYGHKGIYVRDHPYTAYLTTDAAGQRSAVDLLNSA